VLEPGGSFAVTDRGGEQLCDAARELIVID